MKSSSVTVPFKYYDPCPCGSGSLYSHCHGRQSTLPVSIFQLLPPPGAPTNLQHDRCFMSSTRNCSSKITREHWLSDSILRQIPEITIFGMPGNRDRVRSLPASALTAKILCDRHNSALSPLDDAAGNAFGTLGRAMRHLSNPEPNRKKVKWYIVDGFALELWAIKALLGVHFGKISAADGEPTLSALHLDIPQAAAYLAGKPLEWPLGFYYLSCWLDGAAAGLSTLSEGEELCGIRMTLQSFTFDSFVSMPDELEPVRAPKNRHRPAILEIVGPRSTSFLVFAWSGVNVGDSYFRTHWPPSDG